MKLELLLLLALLATAWTAKESCMERCENGFDATKPCQCDSMCTYYRSCCSDYESLCRILARGDTFPAFPEDEENSTEVPPTLERTVPPPPLRTLPQSPLRTLPYSPLGTVPPPSLTTVPPPPLRTLPQSTLRTLPYSPLGTVPPPSLTTVPPPPLRTLQHTPIRTVPPPPLGTELPPPLITLHYASQETVPPPPPGTVPPPPPCDQNPTAPPVPDPDAEICSGRPFDSFMQLKNGSVYAFRGKYFFELDEKSVLPGYPKLIEDIWGIKGPINAAFTRINCQGKTYIFKGNQYWRFDNGVLDEDFPRDISVGFEKIPDHLDAAFAIPAHSHHGKEKVYFFKGDRYYQYEFKHQPSHEECFQLYRSSPSALFSRYTDLYYDRWTEYFNQLFSGLPNHHGSHHFIDKDWIGIKAPVDAVLAGRLYISSKPSQRPSRRRQDDDQQWDQQRGQQWGQQWDQQRGQQWGQQWGQEWGSRRRQNRSPLWDTMAERGINIGQEFAQKYEQERWRDQDRRRNDHRRQYDYDYDYRYNPAEDWTTDILRRGQPLQSVYFFKGDQYYRVDLRTKRVDRTFPPYPRPIGKYWLGCPDKPGAEKR